MQINRVTRKVRLDSKLSAIRYQLITELVFLRKQSIIENDLTYLALLTLWGPLTLKEFCKRAVTYIYGDLISSDVDKHPVKVQTVRNRLGILEKRGLIEKMGNKRKMLRINPALNLVTSGNILLEYNFLYIEANEVQRADTKASPGVAVL